ncbi:hypothetical protein CPB86DRAFT_739378 [Serendipita vermifera]|nr:hypothetical protein CPB86DRAFT_739378 [Serendipita vermifera]
MKGAESTMDETQSMNLDVQFDSDDDMHSARSNLDSDVPDGAARSHGHTGTQTPFDGASSVNLSGNSAKKDTLDLLDRMPNVYRLLDLINEVGTSGLVEKMIVAQESVALLANRIEPGSCPSLTKVNFQALDKHRIRPQGVYGSITAMADFFKRLEVIDEETYDLLVQPCDASSGVSRPTLRPGLYLYDARSIQPDLFYIIFWPEDNTWQDGTISAASRNRVTFMRYLTKLCDQVICLLSDEHSNNLVWPDEEATALDVGFDVGNDDIYERLFSFSVKQTNEEEENVIPREGFTVQHLSISASKVKLSRHPKEFPLNALEPRLIVGDIAQATLHVDYIPEEITNQVVEWEYKRSSMEAKLRKDFSPVILLHNNIDRHSLALLLDLKLGNRCGNVEAEWKKNFDDALYELEQEKAQLELGISKELESVMKELKKVIPFWLVRQAATHYDTLPEDRMILSLLPESGETIDHSDVSAAILQAETFFKEHPDLKTKILTTFRQDIGRLEAGHWLPYNTLKRQFRWVDRMLSQDNNLSDEQAQGLIDLILNEHTFQTEFKKIVSKASDNSNSWIPAFLRGNSTSTVILSELPYIDDIQFLKKLASDIKKQPAYLESANIISGKAMSLLNRKLKTIHKTSLNIIKEQLRSSAQTKLNVEFSKRKKYEEGVAWDDLRVRLQKALIASAPDDYRVSLLIHSVKRDVSKAWPSFRTETFHLVGMWREPNRSGFQYSIHQMGINSDDVQKISIDPLHICQPVFRNTAASTFVLPSPTDLRFIRLLGKDDCIAIVEDVDSLKVYLDPVNVIAASIESDKHKKRFPFGKIGKANMFALDEARRLFVIVTCHSDSIRVHLYNYDLETRNLNARGGAIDITKWFPNGIPHFHSITFVPGTDELLFVDTTGLCRLFYLPTEAFRPSELQVGRNLLSISSSPDGSCLCAFDLHEGSVRLRCFHWTSFGTTDGIFVELPQTLGPETPLQVSSVGNKASVHVIWLDPDASTCSSIAMRITRKSTDYEFSSNDVRESTGDRSMTQNNTLIDCHSEVWTRFPIQATICKESTRSAKPAPKLVHFVSSAASHQFSSYFSSMISKFEHKTRKPTHEVLSRIHITESGDWNPYDPPHDVSTMHTGDWLVGLFCLIPIHIAITKANRFIPLKDGVISSKFERSLLGASVSEISESLSLGWYESIFNSYLASLPVKVITSMGEQSVGKSYALNHFVDTSFAGSAMRCTEGVWLSVTPTRNMLYVAMDFEGVQSIERSAQEDTLLVLLNTAISNLVLFRNNFALSRDITELFTSFQSCTTILDPASNPDLFQSCLVIIVKDVISSDAREIKLEFGQKFSKIVQRERAQNFITKLHKGKLDIIPWPVIESPQFYMVFDLLKKRLAERPVSHQYAVQFMEVLKTLMAKLKANDWGALDQNLASQRAEYLSSLLVTALAFGTTDPSTMEPLKNCDTDDNLYDNFSTDTFYVPSAVNPMTREALDPGSCLHTLRVGWPQRLERFEMVEAEYLNQFNAYLKSLANARVNYVRAWLKANTTRFGEKAELTILLRRFESLARELQAAIVLCGSICSSCGLLCLEQKHHIGPHDCLTSHRCSEPCAFIKEHDNEVADCDMPAGHTGRHVCKVLSHICCAPCDLSERDGCMQFCSKPVDHDDMEHTCAALVHACGEPCDLDIMDTGGEPLCSRKCVIDRRLDHQRHCCERPLECPVRCQLCSSYCTSGNHFHPLNPEAVHLCSEEHACNHDCGNEGICEIATMPHAIETTFTGRHETFQYTKYTQVARRLPCIIPIDAGELNHEGPHIHTKDSRAHHYCEQKCEYCGYYCTLHLGHKQKDHETSHGSMSKTQWLVDGDNDATLDLDGRRYASGDSGAPMLCSLLCKTMGRHVHVANCKAEDPDQCFGEGLEHVRRNEDVGGQEELDWITHRLFWARSGAEHDPNVNQGAVPSLCQLPIFHASARPEDAPPSGYVSHDGHVYGCKNPAVMRRSFHILFAIDRSGSMLLTDCRPLNNTPASRRIAQHADNRYGAALTSLYGFWLAREVAQRPGYAAAHRDAYTVIAFDHNAAVVCSNDTESGADQLLGLLPNNATEDGGTNFTQTLELLRRELENTWTTERYPVVIFMSDGERAFEEEVAYDLCRAAVRLGRPLAFHTVAFGEDIGGGRFLRRMTDIATDIYDTAPPDPLLPAGENPCSFTEAKDTVELAKTYLSIAESLSNPRAALRRL